MTPRVERSYKPEYAKELLSIAEGDLQSARALHSTRLGRPENVCYHAEQSIEKCLKAVLCHAGRSVPLTHDLGTLSERVSQIYPLPVATDLSGLTEFATIRRYEEGAMILEEEDILSCMDIATQVFCWAKSIVK